MRRQDLQLLNRARSGDFSSQCEIGRRYILGIEGFPRNLSLGLGYLRPAMDSGRITPHLIVAESLPLEDLVRSDLLRSLEIAAKSSSATSQFKLAIWKLLIDESSEYALEWLARSKSLGHQLAARALESAADGDTLESLLSLVEHSAELNVVDVARLATEAVLASKVSDRLVSVCAAMLRVAPHMTPEMADAALEVLKRSPETEVKSERSLSLFEAALENCVARGSPDAAFMLGLACCGRSYGGAGFWGTSVAINLRKGAALLLRAADGGRKEAWPILYSLHADNRASVANPQMARFFLEKAATCGDPDSQRRLGALILKSATTIPETEHALYWLHAAAGQGDDSAVALMRSLVLPVRGEEYLADSAIEAIRQEDPRLACRLRTARDYGLTRIEALCVDIMAGVRPWGLVVGENRYLAQPRLAQPRAVPSVDEQIHKRLLRSAAYFEQSRQDGAIAEGDLRRRSVNLRRALTRYGIDEGLFFANASSSKLDTLRYGHKWAFSARPLLRSALSAGAA